MDGLDILTRTLSTPVPMGPGRALWQYHPRSDRHSKIACWGVLFDLLQHSAQLREHVRLGKVIFGLNHVMRNFENNKKKALDLVIAQPGSSERSGRTFLGLMDKLGIELTIEQHEVLRSLPNPVEGPVGSVLIAMEAKACMTEHIKALPRLYDELNSSHQIVHASRNSAISVGFAMINAATTFISPDRNKNVHDPSQLVITTHKRRDFAERTAKTIDDLPRRTGQLRAGYDGIALVVVEMTNDGSSPVKLVTGPPAPELHSVLHYDSMIIRVASEYDHAYHGI